MLTFNALRQANTTRQIEWESGTSFSLEYLGNAMAGECGEACNVIKKLVRNRLGARGNTATVADLGEELADIIIYADLIARKEGIDLGDAVRDKFNKTSKAYNLGVLL